MTEQPMHNDDAAPHEPDQPFKAHGDALEEALEDGGSEGDE